MDRTGVFVEWGRREDGQRVVMGGANTQLSKVCECRRSYVQVSLLARLDLYGLVLLALASIHLPLYPL